MLSANSSESVDGTSPESGVQRIPLARTSAIISAGDAFELRRFFGGGGFSVFAHSPMAAMLARAELFAMVARPCGRCGGDRAKGIPGTGFVSSRTGKQPKEISERTREWAALIGLDIRDIPAPLGDQLCSGCDGRGWSKALHRTRATGALTARPMGSSVKKAGGGVELDVGDLALLGRVSTRLKAAQALAAPLPADLVLEAWYSPDGGDIGAIWFATPAGIKMLRKNHLKLHPREFFRNERARQEEHPDANRRALFAAADSQATEAFERSCRAWNEARGART